YAGEEERINSRMPCDRVKPCHWTDTRTEKRSASAVPAYVWRSPVSISRGWYIIGNSDASGKQVPQTLQMALAAGLSFLGGLLDTRLAFPLQALPGQLMQKTTGLAFQYVLPLLPFLRIGQGDTPLRPRDADVKQASLLFQRVRLHAVVVRQ